MDVYGSVEKDTIAYGLGTWVRTHNAWVLWEGHGMVRMLLTVCTVCVCQYWTYGRDQEGTLLAWVDRRGRWSSKRVDYDIMPQGLIRLIEYAYHQGIPIFWKPTCKELWG
jgi:hypothetical protein